MIYFGAGVQPEIGKVILARAVAPATIEEMLTAAKAVEAELAKKGAPGTSALAIAPDDQQTPNDLEELTRQVENCHELRVADERSR